MQQQVESYKHALRDWDEQQQRHRAAIQQARASQLTGSSSADEQQHTATTAWNCKQTAAEWQIVKSCYYPLLSYFLESFNSWLNLPPPNHFVDSHDFLHFFLFRDFKASSSEKEKKSNKMENYRLDIQNSMIISNDLAW